MQFIKLDKIALENNKKIYWYGINFPYKFIPLKISNYFKKIYSIKLYSIQKGYSIAQKRYGDDLYFEILKNFENENLNIKNKNFSKIIFGCEIEDKEKLIKQYLIKYLYHPMRFLSISRTILYSLSSKKKIIYPLHKNIYNFLISKNLNVNKTFCNIFWVISILFFFIYGCKKVFSIIFASSKYNFEKGVHFLNLPSEALNISNNMQSSKFNYFSFILQYLKEKKFDLNKINHDLINANNIHTREFLISYSDKFKFDFNLRKRIQFFLWSMNALFLCLYDFLRGYWWHPLLLSEAAERKFVEIINVDSLHSMYLFNNTSGFAYKPMWTYEAEKKGVEIIFYFYSLNYFPNTKKFQNPVGMTSMSWKNFAVWGSEHEKQIKKYTKYNINIISKLPIFFNTGKKDFIAPKKNFITVFDLTPIRPIFRKSNLFQELYSSDNIIKFLNDLIEISENNNLTLILKTKRIHNLIDKKYLNYLNKEIVKKRILLINDNISSISLIRNSKLIISYPLTSTSQLANYFGVENYYYCPSKFKFSNHVLLGSSILYNKKDINNILSKRF